MSDQSHANNSNGMSLSAKVGVWGSLASIAGLFLGIYALWGGSIGGNGGGATDGDGPGGDLGTHANPIRLSDTELLNAQKSYLDKWLQVTGTVSQVEANKVYLKPITLSDGRPSLAPDTAPTDFRVTCVLRQHDGDPPTVGSTVVIKGLCKHNGPRQARLTLCEVVTSP